MKRLSIKRNNFHDSTGSLEEQLPKKFSVSFKETWINNKPNVLVVLNDNMQVGDVINDNAYSEDFYRYHDVFHYSFASLLGWSPCIRSMLKCKRKSNPVIDEIEDGARATITEEALSLLIFNEAKRKNLFEKSEKISKTTLRIIKEMTEPFEVKVRTTKDWESTILKAYAMFRLLIKNNGGKVKFDGINKTLEYIHLN